MSDAMTVEPYQESRIEDEPILGPVLAMPDVRKDLVTRIPRQVTRGK